MNLPIVTSLRVSDLLGDGDAFFEQSHNLGIRLKPEKNPRPSLFSGDMRAIFRRGNLSGKPHCAVIAQEARLEDADRPERVCVFRGWQRKARPADACQH